MDRYIGIDVHAQSCTCAVLGPTGKRLQVEVIETEGEALVRWVRGVVGQRHLCFEEGTQSAWLYELIEPHVQELLVIAPVRRDGVKNDEQDALWLAEQLRLGAFKQSVFKGSGAFSSLRAAVRGYAFVTQDLVRVKNRLRALYRSRGLYHLGKQVYAHTERATHVAKLPMSYRPLAELLGCEMDRLLEMQKLARERLKENAREHSIVGLLATAPGLGTIRAAQVATVIISPHRFRTVRQFWSYCGFGIVMRSSSDWKQVQGQWRRAQVAQTRGLNRNRNLWLKSAFKSAAMSVISKLPDHPLHHDYQRRLAAGIKPNLARLTLARQIAAIVLAMWKHKEAYDPSRHRFQTTT